MYSGTSTSPPPLCLSSYHQLLLTSTSQPFPLPDSQASASAYLIASGALPPRLNGQGSRALALACEGGS